MSSRKEALLDAKELYLARRKALGLPVGNTVTRVKDKTFYLNVRIDGKSGVQKLIDNETKKVVGITNFDKNTLVKGRVLVIDSIRTKVTNLGRSEKEASYGNILLTGEMQGIELTLTQGKEVLIDLPLSDTAGFVKDDFRPLSNMPMIVDEQEFEWSIEIPKDVIIDASPTAGNGVFLSIQVRCTEFFQS